MGAKGPGLGLMLPRGWLPPAAAKGPGIGLPEDAIGPRRGSDWVGSARGPLSRIGPRGAGDVNEFRLLDAPLIGVRGTKGPLGTPFPGVIDGNSPFGGSLGGSCGGTGVEAS